MSDINLLPEDLKKKQEKILAKKSNLNDSIIEFTEAQKLQQQNSDSRNLFSTNNKFTKWNPLRLNSNKDQYKNTKTTEQFPKNYQKTSHEDFDIDNLEVKPEKSPRIVLDKNIKDNNKFVVEKDSQNKELLKVGKVNVEDLKKEKSKKTKFYKSIFKKIFGAKKENLEIKKDVNLLPSNLNIASKKKITTILISTLIISIVVVFVIYFGISLYSIRIKNKISSLDSQINNVIAESKQYDNLIVEIENLRSRVLKIKELLNKHVYWTKFFKELEENTLPEVRFNSFAGSIDSNISLSATAPDYYTLSRQWIQLSSNKNFVDDVVINNASMSGGSQGSSNDVRVNFSITLDLVDNIFYKINQQNATGKQIK